MLIVPFELFAFEQQTHLHIQNLGVTKTEKGVADKNWLQLWNIECMKLSSENSQCAISVINITEREILAQSNTNRNQNEISEFTIKSFKDVDDLIKTRVTFKYEPSWRLNKELACSLLLAGDPSSPKDQTLSEFKCISPGTNDGYEAIKFEKELKMKMRAIGSSSLNYKDHSISTK
jgi:hypothetical protein